MRRSAWSALVVSVALAAAGTRSATGQEARPEVVVGCKNFTESRILGEIFALLLEEHAGVDVELRTGLGGTLVCHQALLSGELDIYPEYSGTAWSTILNEAELVTDPLRAFLHVARAYRERFDVEWSQPLGFENAYALALNVAQAERLGIRRISDLAAHAPELAAGFGIEFMKRSDGYPGLCEHYGLEFGDVRSIDHGLAYDAIEAGVVDLIDVYSTDGRLLGSELLVLEDDRRFFPPYHVAALTRRETLARHTRLADALARLAWRIPNPRMVELNHAVDVEKRDPRTVAREFLDAEGLLGAGAVSEDGPQAGPDAARMSARELGRLVLEHLWLTFVAVVLAAVVAIPSGIWLSRHAAARRASLAAAGILQTVPSLALLAVFIAVPGLGLSERSAILALFLYALLPILRNTVTGLNGVDADLIDAARGMGLRESEILARIQLPLATRTIMAGVRTATVISVGVATLAAFIGAGGLGEPILTGLYLNDTRLVLFGALPAAALALLVDAGLALLEHRLVPRGLRLRGPQSSER